MKRFFAACLTAGCVLTATLLPGCALIPQEEELPQMPVVADIPETVLETVPVLRGALKEEKTFTCTFQPAEEENLYFEESGQPIAAVFVKAGDEVKAGDLLAELDNTLIHQSIASQQHAIDALKLRIAQEQDCIALEKERIAVLQALAQKDASYSSKVTSAEAALESRSSQLTYLYAQLSVENSTLEELDSALQERQLYASIDGTVSYALELGTSPVYSSRQTVCTVQNLDGASFLGSFPQGLLEAGQTQTLSLNGSTVEVLIRQVTPTDGKGSCTVSFSLVAPDPSLKSGDKAYLTLVSNSLEDALYLPNTAIQTQNGVSFIYYPGEDGILSVKEVKTGLRINSYVQIVSGLEEGDPVLKKAP